MSHRHNYTYEDQERMNQQYNKWVETYSRIRDSVLEEFPFLFCSSDDINGPCFKCRWCDSKVYDVQSHLDTKIHKKKTQGGYFSVSYRRASAEHRYYCDKPLLYSEIYISFFFDCFLLLFFLINVG